MHCLGPGVNEVAWMCIGYLDSVPGQPDVLYRMPCQIRWNDVSSRHALVNKSNTMAHVQLIDRGDKETMAQLFECMCVRK